MLISLVVSVGDYGLFAQKYEPIAGQSLTEMRQVEVLPVQVPVLRTWPSLESTPPPASYFFLPSRQTMAYDRKQDLALFCRLEVRMEKASRLPVKFRLGEVQYAEQREGKLKNSEDQRN